MSDCNIFNTAVININDRQLKLINFIFQETNMSPLNRCTLSFLFCNMHALTAIGNRHVAIPLKYLIVHIFSFKLTQKK